MIPNLPSVVCPAILTGILAKARQGSTPKQPLVPPTTRVHRDPANNNATQSFPTSQPVIPGSEQATTGTTQMVTGRLSQKPAPPPKPNFKNKQNSESYYNIPLHTKLILN